MGLPTEGSVQKLQISSFFCSSCGAEARNTTVNTTSCGFDPHLRKWNIYLHLYYHYTLVYNRRPTAIFFLSKCWITLFFSGNHGTINLSIWLEFQLDISKHYVYININSSITEWLPYNAQKHYWSKGRILTKCKESIKRGSLEKPLKMVKTEVSIYQIILSLLSTTTHKKFS